MNKTQKPYNPHHHCVSAMGGGYFVCNKLTIEVQSVKLYINNLELVLFIILTFFVLFYAISNVCNWHYFLATI